MLDDGFEDRLKRAARDYNVPPETPREEMWAAIQAERAEKAEKAEQTDEEEKAESPSVGRFRPLRPLRLLRPLSAIAAILALGFAVGRLTQRPAPVPPSPTVAVETRSRARETAYQLATTEHLSQSEAFLTLFRASLRTRGGNEQLASATARQLLATNRLLLDSPAASNGRTRLLLQDLELVLAEIAQLSPQPRARDLNLITESLEQGGVLSRLRTAVPSGGSTTQGAL